MFASGESDEYPAWALPLLMKRVLWQQYGVAFSDMSFDEILDAMYLNSLEKQREKALHDREASRINRQ